MVFTGRTIVEIQLVCSQLETVNQGVGGRVVRSLSCAALALALFVIRLIFGEKTKRLWTD